MIKRLGWAIASSALALFASAATMGSAAQASTPSIPTVSFTQILPRQTIFNWNKTVCSPDHFIPDGPARAWKRADGKFTLVAEEADDWQLVGTSPFDLQASCRPTLYDGYPSGYNSSIPASGQYLIPSRGYIGIMATYTLDGTTIYGFAGQDLSPLAYKAGCVDNGGGNCWLNDIQAVVSKDMGDDFNFVSPTNGDVAALSHVVSSTPAGRPGQDGYMTSTNIIQKPDGYFYMIAHVENAGTGYGTACLMRTNNLADPSSWRGMNFDASGNPQFNGILQPSSTTSVEGATPCSGLGPYSLWQSVYSINYIPAKHLYIALMQTRLKLPGDAQFVPGAYYSTSPDLISWSPTKRLLVTPLVPGYDSNTEIDEYPVLIDPFSKSRNFETIDSATPVVVYTLAHVVNNGVLTLDRDIVAVPFLMQ